MAGGRIVGITVDIEGRSDGLVKSLKDCNSAISNTSAALKDVDKALQLDPTNVELLTQKEELLNKQIDQTNERLEILQQVAEDANEALAKGDISQEQYASLQAEIARTNSELDGLNEKADENSQVMQDVEDGVAGAGDEMEELGTESEETGKAMDALKVTAEAVGGAMAAAFAAAVAGAKEVGEALVSCTMDAAAYSDEIMTMSSVTGLSTDTLQELNYAAELLDVSTETITGSMTKLEKTMSSADATHQKYSETVEQLMEQLEAGKITQEEYEAACQKSYDETRNAYDKLGVSIRDSNGEFRSQEEVFWDVIDALGQIEDPVERDLAAMELLGKSAKDLNPLIEAGSGAFRDLAEEAHETGYVMDGDTLDAFGAFDDQMARLNNGATAAKNALGQVLLPTLNSLAGAGTSALNKFTLAMQESDGDISKLGPAVSEILQDLLGEVNTIAPQIFDLIGTILQTLVQIIIDNLPMILDSALQIITTLTETLLAPDNLAKIIEAATNIILTIVQYLLENIDLILNAAIQIILTVVQGITDALPQLIPAAVDAILTIAETLLAPENLAMILDAALKLIIALAGALVDALPEIIDRLPEIITGIVDFLLGPDGLDKLVSTGFDLFIGLITKLPDVVLDILEAVAGMIGDIVGKIVEKGGEVWDALKEMFPSFDEVVKWGGDIIDGIIDGITGALSDLWDTCTDVAQGIADFLGFSVPEKGPLHEWAYNNPGADMVDLFAEGIDDQLPELQASVDMMANAMTGASPTSPDYSGQLSGISETLAGMGGGVINVYLGQELIQREVIQANTNYAFISGGR